ncbi:MAG TPA: acetolactate synthase large subunit [Thermodesulfovibrionia bacterium]|nr:acetolactate synthase large subunit [Thermodesulfovibrionia bacterium]
MKAAELFVKCLENEKVKYIFGIPGEENIDVMDALLDSSIQFITTRHEQGAAFMADVYGRLTGQAGVCLSTLGPGATNLMTGVADANMDHAPVVAIAGQASTTRLHKESHQVLNLVNMFQPITKYASSILTPEIIPEVVRKAFKVAQAEKPGVSFIEFPDNVAEMEVQEKPLKVQAAAPSLPSTERLNYAVEVISRAKRPIILAGNGVVRAKASGELTHLAETLNIPVATTFMAKGVIPFSHPLALGTVGLQAHDLVNCGFDRADVIICVGYDIVEYQPNLWHPTRDRKIVHIDRSPAEVDASYIVEVGVVGDIKHTLSRITELAVPKNEQPFSMLRQILVDDIEQHGNDRGCPVKPQKLIWDMRRALDPKDIVISDVGAHKIWIARMFPCEHPNTCIISNGFASMGIAVPGAIAAKLVYPERTVVAATGDGGFMMNSQEIETAMRIGVPIIIVIWNDNSYGLIEWKQIKTFGRASNVRFTNPDFVKYAESFGANGYRVECASELLPILKDAMTNKTVSVIDCPVDYSENLKLTQKLGAMICPT